MTSDKFREALKHFYLTQEVAANLFGISVSSIRRYCSGETPVSTPVAQLITLMLQHKITDDDVRRTGQSPFISSRWEEDDFYRRIGKGPVTIVWERDRSRKTSRTAAQGRTKSPSGGSR